MKVLFESRDLEDLIRQLKDLPLKVDEELKPEMLKIGGLMADTMVDAINSGIDLSGQPLKGSRRKGKRPLIKTGKLATRGAWRVKFRKSKAGIASVTANPSSDRTKVFYGFLPNKGYDQSQGVPEVDMDRYTRLISDRLMLILAKYMKVD